MVKLTFTLDDATVERLRTAAARLRKPQSQIVREAGRDPLIDVPRPFVQQFPMAACFLAAATVSLATWWLSIRAGIRALQAMDRAPS